MFQRACKLGFEGIISKRKDSPSCPPKLSAVQSSWDTLNTRIAPAGRRMALRSMTYQLDVLVSALTSRIRRSATADRRSSRRCGGHACSCRCARPWVLLIPWRHHAYEAFVLVLVVVQYVAAALEPGARRQNVLAEALVRTAEDSDRRSFAACCARAASATPPRRRGA